MQKDGKRGFTLVEILIALAILVMIAVPIARSFIQSAKTTKSSGEIIKATQLAQSQIENVKNLLQANDLTAITEAQIGGFMGSDFPIVTGSYNITSPAVSTDPTVAAWKTHYKDKYEISYSVSKNYNSSIDDENNGETMTDSGTKINSQSSPYTLGAVASSSIAGYNKQMNISISEAASGKVIFKNMSAGGVDIAPETAYSSGDMTLYMDGSTITDSTIVNIDNEFENFDTLNIIVLNAKNYKLKFQMDSNTSYPINNIIRSDITDSVSYNNSSGEKRKVEVYDIKIDVVKLDNSSEILADIKSKRLVRR